MSPLIDPAELQYLRQLQHDIKNALHVVGLGLAVLNSVRDDPTQFAETYAVVDEERRNARDLVAQLLDRVSRWGETAPRDTEAEGLALQAGAPECESA